MFNTIEEYDNELNEIKSRLNNMEKRMERYPNKSWIKGNHDSLNHVYEIILKDREDFLNMMDNTNLHVNDSTQNDFSLPAISEIFGGINEFTANLSSLMKSNMNMSCNNLIPVKRVRSGSLHLSFAMGDEKTDLREVKLNYEVFNTLFDILECDESDLPNLEEKIGEECVESYKNFLKILIKNNFDITLENSRRNVTLIYEDSARIYKILKNSEG